MTYPRAHEAEFASRREVLDADRVYYVDAVLGDDARPGYGPGTVAVRTLQRAVDLVARLDTADMQATIQLAAGTYAGAVALKRTSGEKPVLIKGAGATTIVSGAVANDGGGLWRIEDAQVGAVTVAGLAAIKYAGLSGTLAGAGMLLPFVVIEGMLQALANLVTAPDQALHFTAPDTPAVHTQTAFGRQIQALLDADAARTLFSSVIGVNVQAYDATLAALAGLDAAAGLLEQTGADAFVKRVIGAGAASSILTRGDGDARWQQLSLKSQANGYASLDATGKIPTAELPAAVLGAASYQGGWNAATNTPAIPAAAAGNKGWYYVVTTAGTTAIDGIAEWALGDWIISNGAAWQKVDNTDAVISVAGLLGVISAAALKTALAIAAADITDASANGRSLITAANYAAMKALLAVNFSDLAGSLAIGQVPNDLITYAKLQNVAANKLLGSVAGGDVEEIAATAAGRALLDDTDAAAQRATLAVRERLTAARTYYVRTDGNDNNDGMANTAGGAFLTIQKALDVVGGLDVDVFDATIQCNDGARTAPNIIKAWAGSGGLHIIGNTATPANATITVADGYCFAHRAAAKKVNVSGFKLSTTGAFGSCLYATDGSSLNWSAIDFGAAVTAHVQIDNNGLASATGAYTISASAPRHWFSQFSGIIRVEGRTVTLTGTPAFSTAFAAADRSAIINTSGNTYSGSATGKRYDISQNSVLVFAAGTLPGDTAGTTATGGQVI